MWLESRKKSGKVQKAYEISYDAFLSPKIVFILANKDADEMQPYAAFHLGLHCLSSTLVLFTSILEDKG